jgi:hypothetical protein
MNVGSRTVWGMVVEINAGTVKLIELTEDGFDWRLL